MKIQWRGRHQNRENVRRRVLHPAVERANGILETAGRPPIRSNTTLHALRRTYISLLLEAGENPRVVMAQVRHTDPGLTLRVYAQVMSQREGSASRLDDLLRHHDWAEMGGRNTGSDPASVETSRPSDDDNAPISSGNTRWAVLGSNQRPPACKAGAFRDAPVYAPISRALRCVEVP